MSSLPHGGLNTSEQRWNTQDLDKRCHERRQRNPGLRRGVLKVPKKVPKDEGCRQQDCANQCDLRLMLFGRDSAPRNPSHHATTATTARVPIAARNWGMGTNVGVGINSCIAFSDNGLPPPSG